jgi:hypothetical protein
VNYLRIAQSIALVAASLQFVACEKKVGVSDQMNALQVKFAEERTANDYERQIEQFYRAEQSGESSIEGENIPEVFKTLNIELNKFLYGLDYDSDYKTSNIDFVESLEISCDKKVTYTWHSIRREISYELFVFSSKWSVRHLQICGKITVPPGRRLLIHATEDSKIQNLEIETSAESLLSLRLPKLDYTGDAPKVSLDPRSILQLNFN